MLSIFATCVKTKANIRRWEMYAVGGGRRGCWSKCRLKLEQQSAETGAACGLLCGENWTNQGCSRYRAYVCRLWSRSVPFVVLLPSRRFSYCCSAGGCYTTALQIIVITLPIRWFLHYCPWGDCYNTALQVIVITLSFRWFFTLLPLRWLL